MYGVAEILNTIAENGDEMVSDEHLRCCAEEIKGSAEFFISQLPSPPAGDVTAEAIWDMLIRVDVNVPIAEIREWPPEWQAAAVNWAGAIYAYTTTDQAVVVPDCPFYVHPSQHDKNIGFPNGRPYRSLDREAGTWMASVNGQVVATLQLPDQFNREDAMRFMYFVHKDILKGKEWTV